MKINSAFLLFTGGFINIVLLAFSTAYEAKETEKVRLRFERIGVMMDSLQFKASQLQQPDSSFLHPQTSPIVSEPIVFSDPVITPAPENPVVPETKPEVPQQDVSVPAKDEAEEERKKRYEQYVYRNIQDTFSRLDKLRYRLEQSISMYQTYHQYHFQFRDAQKMHFFYHESYMLMRQHIAYLSSCLTEDDANELADYLVHWINSYRQKMIRIQETRNDDFGLRRDDIFVVDDADEPFPTHIARKISNACDHYQQMLSVH